VPRAAALVVATLVAAVGCSSVTSKKDTAIHNPTESVLEVVAVLRRHVPDDTYRFPPATDFTGRNVYRASLIRLENIERIHAESLRAGHLEAVVAFSKARALERLRAYDIAADYYQLAAERSEALRAEAQISAETCTAFAQAITIGPGLDDPLARATEPYQASHAQEVITELEERSAQLYAATLGAPEHYAIIAREEIERADMARAQWFQAMRFSLPRGQVRAIAERQRLVSRHATSHREMQHVLALANLYNTLAREYVGAVPPESLDFDPPKLRELVDAATQLYQRVASRDGAAEKIEAKRELEAFLAFTLLVDRDRFAAQ
jgi:hypothetical protein